MFYDSNILEQHFSQILDLSFNKKLKKFIVALSGGLDSMVLALIANKWAKANKVQMVTVTIDHNLRDISAKEAQLVQEIMQKEQIKHKIIKWEHKEKITSNIEAVARKARYELLVKYALENQIKVIFTAHHFDDQIENFFIRLSRGSGIDGLSAMSNLSKTHQDFIIFRPFLDIKKIELEKYAKVNDIKWFNDKTNQDRKYLRNNLRYLLSEIEDKEIIEKRIAKTIKHFARAKEFLQITADKSYLDLVTKTNDEIKIEFLEFKNLHIEIALRILVKILMEIGKTEYKPRFEKLEILYYKIIREEINKSTSFNHCLIKVEKNYITFVKEEKTRS